jgi:prepilin-type N-terminal cleavage/methylation domain-containing protein
MFPRRRKHGQTLVEILVVVAIISIVISILVPAAFMLVKAVHRLKGS